MFFNISSFSTEKMKEHTMHSIHQSWVTEKIM